MKIATRRDATIQCEVPQVPCFNMFQRCDGCRGRGRLRSKNQKLKGCPAEFCDVGNVRSCDVCDIEVVYSLYSPRCLT